MSNLELTDALFAKLAGWEAVKTARQIIAAGKVLHSDWQPPLLRGTVMEGGTSLRAGLIIKSATDAENICPCRDSRQRGLICAHAVAVGLHYVKVTQTVVSAIPTTVKPVPIKTNVRAIRRTKDENNGEDLEIFLILPPNFSEALGRNKLMLYLEGKASTGRLPLNALPLDVPYKLSPQDGKLLEAIEKLNGGDTPAMVMLNVEQFCSLLPILAGHSQITLGKTETLQILMEPSKLSVEAKLDADGEIILALLGKGPAQVLNGETCWEFKDLKLRPLSLPREFISLLNEPLRIPRARVPQFLSGEWQKLLAQCDLKSNFALEDFICEAATPQFKLHLAGGLALLEATLTCFYGDKEIIPSTVSQGEAVWLPDPKVVTRYFTRNAAAEKEGVLRLARSGFIGPDGQGRFQLKNQNQILSFFARKYPRLEKEWEVSLEERLQKSADKNLEYITPKFQITASGEQWFDLNIGYETGGGEKFAAADIQRLLLSGQSHTKLKNGKFALLDTGAVEELQEVLVDCAPEQNAGRYRVANTQMGFLDATLRQQTEWQVEAPAVWQEQVAQQRGEIKFPEMELGALATVLRPYQKAGTAWLAFLRAHRFGGILADEMGLGKTVQVLALINSLKLRDQKLAPVLVICPTSLVYNWAAEAAKFAPALRILALHGPKRQQLFKQLPEHDLIITSYSLLRRDAENYRGREFDTVILDEAQHIKNRQTQNAQMVKTIKSRHRLVLTGTPMENSVLDLWSIFDFLMPNYLGTAPDFRERYEVPIVRDKDSAAQARLSRRIRPFLLRRLKREVAKDLPDKIEQVSYCDLNDEQRSAYQQILEASRRQILEADNATGSAKSRMLVLTALLRLRQICCDLRLLNLKVENEPDAAEDEPVEKLEKAALATSGKVELFKELLAEVIDGGHRALVFSQFTSMLGLLREELAAQEIEFCYLDGATQDRANVVEKFQRGNAPVFLISLKAGGVGLNLTAADTVIHFDPWWNPAVEAQATDRAHRIGQQKIVTSYKLISRGTVEEKILNLQSRKRVLTQGMLGDEAALLNSLDWKEIQELLAT